MGQDIIGIGSLSDIAYTIDTISKKGLNYYRDTCPFVRKRLLFFKSLTAAVTLK
jgi:hypothetical protein